MSYTVSKEQADLFVLQHPDQRLVVTERRSQGGWGVWQLDDDHWVFVTLGAKERHIMTKDLAEWLAAALGVDEYSARKLRGRWLVWCDASNHAVEFDDATLEAAARGDFRDVEAQAS